MVLLLCGAFACAKPPAADPTVPVALIANCT